MWGFRDRRDIPVALGASTAHGIEVIPHEDASGRGRGVPVYRGTNGTRRAGFVVVPFEDKTHPFPCAIVITHVAQRPPSARSPAVDDVVDDFSGASGLEVRVALDVVGKEIAHDCDASDAVTDHKTFTVTPLGMDRVVEPFGEERVGNGDVVGGWVPQRKVLIDRPRRGDVVDEDMMGARLPLSADRDRVALGGFIICIPVAGSNGDVLYDDVVGLD